MTDYLEGRITFAEVEDKLNALAATMQESKQNLADYLLSNKL